MIRRVAVIRHGRCSSLQGKRRRSRNESPARLKSATWIGGARGPFGALIFRGGEGEAEGE